MALTRRARRCEIQVDAVEMQVDEFRAELHEPSA
jgi:hypothetical protein